MLTKVHFRWVGNCLSGWRVSLYLIHFALSLWINTQYFFSIQFNSIMIYSVLLFAIFTLWGFIKG